MKKAIAGWLASLVRKLDPGLDVFREAMEVEHERSLTLLRSQWRTLDFHKALRYQHVQGGDPNCEHSNVTGIKKYRNQDWTQECRDCGASLTLFNCDNVSHSVKPIRGSKRYLRAELAYLNECIRNDSKYVVPFEELDRKSQIRFLDSTI
jgi:hypothetical protein